VVGATLQATGNDEDRAADRVTGEVSVARALRSTTRAGIYDHLRQAAAALTVRDIAATFDLHPNVARTHLELLADAGLVVVGRRKHPGGGRPAKVYLAREDVAAELAPVQAGLRGSGAAGVALLVTLLVGLLDSAAERDVGDQALTTRAYEVAAADGRRQVSSLGTRPDSPTLEAAAEVAVRALRSHAPEARIVRSGSGWVDIGGVRGVFRMLEPVQPQLAEALERGLVVGAMAAAGAAVTLADAGVAPGGGRIWRAHSAAPVTGRLRTQVSGRVDARGLARETGVVRAMRVVTGLAPGEVLEVLAAGPGAPAAFARWADRAGHVLLGVERATDAAGRPGIRLLIRKGSG
jgi:predicted ArsR family transcriptional regulator/TusA-related sulfurtransferase